MDASTIEDFEREHPIQMFPDEIEKIITAIKSMPDDGLMVEWGSGASTVRWLKEMRASQRLISIEHSRTWFEIVSAALDHSMTLSSKLTYHLCQTNGYHDHGYGGLDEENPVGLDRYFHPDPNMYDADLFLIDGVARGVCAQFVKQIASKACPIVFLHDWFPRALWYSWSVETFKSHERVGTTLCQLTIR